MPQVIFIEGEGELEFPDNFTDEQISSAIYSNFPHLKQPTQDAEIVAEVATPEEATPEQINKPPVDHISNKYALTPEKSQDLIPYEEFPQQEAPDYTVRDDYIDIQRTPVEEAMFHAKKEGKRPLAPDYNVGRGAIERAGDVGAGLLETVEATAYAAEDNFGLGGFVYEDGYLPTYLNKPEYMAWKDEGGQEVLAEAKNGLKNFDAGYVPTHTWEALKEEFTSGESATSAVAEVFLYSFEQGVKSVPDMVAVMLNMPAYVIARSGEMGETRALNKGKEKPELTDIIEAVPFALGSALLEKIGAKGITDAGAEALGKEALKQGFDEVSKRVAKEGGKAFVKEAATEALQEGVIEYVGEKYGTDAAMSAYEAFDRGFAGAVAGGPFGGAAGASVAGAKEYYNAPSRLIPRELNKAVDQSTIQKPTQPMIEMVNERLINKGLPPIIAKRQDVLSQKGTIPGVTYLGDIQAPQQMVEDNLLLESDKPITPIVEVKKQIKKAQKSRNLDESKDELLVAISKLGGIRATGEGSFDGVDNKNVRGYGIKRVFHDGKTSRQMDDMAEVLHEAGYLENRDLNELFEKVGNSLNGNPQYTAEGFGQYEANRLEEANNEEEQRYAFEYESVLNQIEALPEAERKALTKLFNNDSQKDDFSLDDILRWQDDVQEYSKEQKTETTASDTVTKEVETDLLGDNTRKEQAIADLQREKDLKRSPEGEQPPMAQTGDDLFAHGGELEPDLFDDAKKDDSQSRESQFPVGVGFEKRTKKLDKQIDKSVDDAVEQVKKENKELRDKQKEAHRTKMLSIQGKLGVLGSSIIGMSEKGFDKASFRPSAQKYLTEALELDAEVTLKHLEKLDKTYKSYGEGKSFPDGLKGIIGTKTKLWKMYQEALNNQETKQDNKLLKIIRENAKDFMGNFGGVPLAPMAISYVEAIVKKGDKLNSQEEMAIVEDFVSNHKELDNRKTDLHEVVKLFEGKSGFGFGQLQKKSMDGDKEAKELTGQIKKKIKVSSLKEHQIFYDNLKKGNATPESIKEAFDSLEENRDRIKFELGKLTKKELLKKSGGLYLSMSDKKERLVQSALDNLDMAFILKEMFSYSMGSRKSTILRAIDGYTQDDINKFAERTAKEQKEREERIKGIKKALANPETLEEYKTFVHYKGDKNLTEEQLVKYDDLRAEAGLERIKKVKQEKAKITAISGEFEFTETNTKHTKKGHDLFVLQVSKGDGERIAKDDFNDIRNKAKQLGGYYSSYRVGGAIPGFQFKTESDRDSFKKLLSGEEVDTSEKLKVREEAKTIKKVGKLRAFAEKMKSEAEADLGMDRKTHTARYAAQAESSEASANKKLAMAETMLNLSEAIDSGEAKYLSGISAKTHVETLDKLINRAKSLNYQKKGATETYSENEKRGVELSDVANISFPVPTLNKASAFSFANTLDDIKGAKRTANKLRDIGRALKEGSNLELSSASDMLMARTIIKKFKESGENYLGWFIRDTLVDIDRLNKMGITDNASLRATLREFIQYRGKAKKLDAVKSAERALAGRKIEGFFPTPKALSSKMLDEAAIEPGMKVLEPSAGKGNLSDAIKESVDNVNLEAIEPVKDLRTILEAKNIKLVGYDFMAHDEGGYDRIIMNPPFEKNQDIQHVKHAYDLLAPGGKIVAITSEHPFFANDKESKEFRNWLDEVDGWSEKNPEGSFKGQGEVRETGVNTRMVVIEKPDTKQATPSETDLLASDLGADTPMPNWTPMYVQVGVPERPNNGTIDVGKRTIKLEPIDKPTRRESIRLKIVGLIGRKLYVGKVKGKNRLGFYKKRNSEVRVSNYDDIEVMAHEIAHFLDYHHKYKDIFSDAYELSKYKQEVKNLSYTSDKKINSSEGFAEFLRLWLTNYTMAQRHAPKFTKKFEQIILKDKDLSKRLSSIRDEMHKWYYQGAQAQLRAKSGNELTEAEQITEFIQKRPLERFRQEVIDKIHAAKVVEKEVHGGLLDATQSAYKQFQMVNGAESIHESVLKFGTPKIGADGSLEFNGKGLNEVFEPVAKKGWNKFNLLMDYFKARRASELMEQGRENLFTKQEISAGLKLGKDNPEFKDVFDEYQKFNERMLNFFTQMGLIDTKQRAMFKEANKNYVPFHRVIEKLEDGSGGQTSNIGARLIGGTSNVKDIAENIVEGLYANIRASLVARAKQTLYKDIMASQEGAMFAVKLGPDSKLVKADNKQMSVNISKVMAELGMTISKDGFIVSGDIDSEQITDVEEIADILEKSPNLLNFFTFGHKPTTLETYVDSAVIDGKRMYFEVNDKLLVDMLTGMSGLRSGVVMNTLFRIKNIQTRTVTSMLQFLGPNIVRDTLSGYVISKNRFIPVYTSLVGLGHFIANSKTYKDFMLQGGGYGTRIEARTEETRSRRQLDLPSRDYFDMAAKLIAGYDRVTSAFEYGTRIGDYSAGLSKGKTKLEAAWEAREVSTDFGKMGLNEVWAKFLRTVPFMNAGIQGLDKTAREIFEMKGEMKGSNLVKFNKAKLRFFAAGASLTAMTAILFLLNNDDDRYNQLTKDQKSRFWWIFIPDMDKPIKIPRPYDVGHLFATVPETALNYAKDKDGKEASETLAWTLINTLGIGDYPGILQPFVEVQRNEKFTGAPIIPGQLMNVDVEYQFNDRTPQMYKSLGKTLGVSPIVAEHYTKGYLRYVEAYISDASEAYLWNTKEWGERPFPKGGFVDYLTHQFVGQKVPYRTKWTEGYYDLKNSAARKKATFNLLRKQEIKEKGVTKTYANSGVNKDLMALDGAFSVIDKTFKDQTAIISSIKYNKKYTKEEKEKRIESWYENKNKTLKQVFIQINDKLKEIEKRVKVNKNGN